MNQPSPEQPRTDWQDVLEEGDEDAFRRLVKPHMDALIEAARRELGYYVQQGHVHEDDFTPEEIAGETLVHAWQHRERRPDPMSLRGWLLGTQHRVLRGLVRQQEQYRADKELSLDESVPLDPDDHDTREWFRDWYQTESQMTWEEVTPGTEPIDYEVPLGEGGETPALEADRQHALMMHDEFEMPLPEVAFTLNRSVRETAERLEQARATLRQRKGEAPPTADTDQPAPPNDSNA